MLAVELRTAIDRAQRRPWDTNATRRALELLDAHPRGLQSAHVRRNIGAARLAWAARTRGSRQVSTTDPLVGGVSESEPEDHDETS